MTITEDMNDIAHARCRADLKAEIGSVRLELLSLERRFDEHKGEIKAEVADMENVLVRKIDKLCKSIDGIHQWMLKVENRIGHSTGQLALMVSLALIAGAGLFGLVTHLLKG